MHSVHGHHNRSGVNIKCFEASHQWSKNFCFLLWISFVYPFVYSTNTYSVPSMYQGLEWRRKHSRQSMGYKTVNWSFGLKRVSEMIWCLKPSCVTKETEGWITSYAWRSHSQNPQVLKHPVQHLWFPEWTYTPNAGNAFTEDMGIEERQAE